jgi:hypothetical protein
MSRVGRRGDSENAAAMDRDNNNGAKSQRQGVFVMSNSVATPPQTVPTTTRREFVTGSSVLLAGVAVAGVVSQTACSSGASGSPTSSATNAISAEDQPDTQLSVRPATTDLVAHCWLEASDLVSAGLTNAANVTLWSDRTDNDYNLQYQPTISDISGVWKHSAPTLTLSAVNNLPAVSFAAPQQQTLIWAPGGSLDQGLTGFSAVFVIQPDSSIIEDASFIFITHDAEQASRVAVVLNPYQGGVRAIVSTNGNEYNVPVLDSGATGIPFGALNDPQWGVLSIRVWYGADPIATLQVNGVSLTIPLSNAATPTTPSYMNALCSDSEMAHVTCSITEMSFYPGYLADAQLSEIETALRQKYGI